jgi:hypothetical protein
VSRESKSKFLPAKSKTKQNCQHSSHQRQHSSHQRHLHHFITNEILFWLNVVSSLQVSDKNFVHISSFSHANYMPHILLDLITLKNLVKGKNYEDTHYAAMCWVQYK